jgi:hypothetical protein
MVEKFINYSENVDNIQEAFAFIMAYMDEFESPDIRIQPYTSYESLTDMSDDDKGELKFGVSVSGTVE